MNNSSLKHFIRSVLNEEYVVNLSATPSGRDPKQKKKDAEVLKSINASFLLTTADLYDIIAAADGKDQFKITAGGEVDNLPEEWQEEITKRFDVINLRFGNDHAVKIAKAAIKKMPTAVLKRVLFNMPDENGAKDSTHPVIGNVYSIPPALTDLALFKKDSRVGAIGKGEALAYLMFGREENKDEPDLIIPDGEGGRGLDIKFFDMTSSLVDPGAAKREDTDDDMNLSEDKADLCSITSSLKSFAETWGVRPSRTNSINKNTLRTKVIAPLLVLLERGVIPNNNESLTSSIERCINLWDSVSLANHDTLCLLRTGGDLFFKAYAADDIKAAAVDFRKSASGMPRPGHPETTAISLRPTQEDLAAAERALANYKVPEFIKQRKPV